MVVGKLYRVNRPNLSLPVGVLLKGVSAAVTIYGSQSKPTAVSGMVDIAGGSVNASGAKAVILLPEFISFTGTVTSIEPVGFSVEDIGAIS